jgi:hypothetical protein
MLSIYTCYMVNKMDVSPLEYLFHYFLCVSLTLICYIDITML